VDTRNSTVKIEFLSKFLRLLQPLEINGRDREGNTIEHLVLIYFDLEMFKYLLDNVFVLKWSSYNQNGYSPLHLAAMKGFLKHSFWSYIPGTDALKLLLTKASIDINQKTLGNKQTALHLAVRDDLIGVVQFLLESNADPGKC
jgi:ankyrin repeat protein